MLGPITRRKTGRSRYRMSQPEPLVRRFNIMSLLRNHRLAAISAGLTVAAPLSRSAAAGPEVTETYIDFFTSTIRNRNTRAAYARACWQFFDWCAAHGLELTTVRPFHVAAWIEDFPGSKPTVKQKLAAVRMLYDFLVVQQITPSNPAHSVRGPKYVVKKGKTPVWSREDAKTLLDSIPKDSVSGLRDLALIAAMFYSFARVSAVLKLRVDDYYHNGARRRLRLHEKGGKEHEMPVHHLLEQILDEYIVAAGLQSSLTSLQKIVLALCQFS